MTAPKMEIRAVSKTFETRGSEVAALGALIDVVLQRVQRMLLPWRTATTRPLS